MIELLIVVAIIAILAAIAVPNFLEAQVRAKVSRAQADMRSIATAIESYRVDNNEFHAPHPGVGHLLSPYWTTTVHYKTVLTTNHNHVITMFRIGVKGERTVH